MTIDGKQVNNNNYYTFTKAGEHEVQINLASNLTSLKELFSNNVYIIKADFSDVESEMITDTTKMFYNCTSLISVNFAKFNTPKLKLISKMFSGCESLTSIDLSNLDTTNVK